MKGVCYCLSRLHESGLLLLVLLLLINIEDLILQVNSDRTRGLKNGYMNAIGEGGKSIKHTSNSWLICQHHLPCSYSHFCNFYTYLDICLQCYQVCIHGYTHIYKSPQYLYIVHSHIGRSTGDIHLYLYMNN